jgi:hypothetical protein
VLVGLVSVSEYGVAAGAILAGIWGPIVGALASVLTWAIRAVFLDADQYYLEGCAMAVEPFPAS